MDTFKGKVLAKRFLEASTDEMCAVVVTLQEGAKPVVRLAFPFNDTPENKGILKAAFTMGANVTVSGSVDEVTSLAEGAITVNNTIFTTDAKFHI